MILTATMPVMGKQQAAEPDGGSVNVQARLTVAEVRELDEAAAEQPIPVKRGALAAFILRDWLRQRREAKGKQKGR
jgi:hypothetical protein